MSDERILVLAPHPDDEIIGCAGVIARALQAGSALRIVEVTSGQQLFAAMAGIREDPSPDEVGALREAETIRACESLGLESQHISFWRFQDGAVEKNRSTIQRPLTELIATYRPTRLYCTSQWDVHPDHTAAFSILDSSRRAAGCSAPICQYSLRETFTRVNQPFECIPLGSLYPVKLRAMQEFLCHIGIVSPKQKQPIMADFIEYYCPPDECYSIWP